MSGRNSRIKLLVAYDGTGYCGWQRQPVQRTVQEEIESALEKLTGEHLSIIASGRTDAGVHARGQVCHFDSNAASIPAEKYALALNSRLPRDIRILGSRRVDSEFHARYSAISREYRYYMKRARMADPFEDPYVYCHSDIPSVRILDQYASMIVGTHDFTTFSAAGDESPSKIRTIGSAAFYSEPGYTVFRIVGNAFLWKMVRSLVGTILELGRSERPVETIRELLCSKDRSRAGTTAPSRGLFLHKVEYDGRYD